MPSHILAKASAAAVVASLALATGAQAHSINGVEQTLRAAQIERELNADYGDENDCITRDARNDRGRDSHFFCSDDSGRRFTVHVLRRGYRLVRGYR